MNPYNLPGVWIIIAAYNESQRLETTLADLLGKYDRIVVVDDGSSDGTGAVARRTGVTVIRHPTNRGQGAAIRTGVRYALKMGAKVIVTFDADGQHCSDDVASLVEPILEGEVDIVLGSRFLGGTFNLPPMRRWILKCGVFFTSVSSGLRITDTHNGLRGFSRVAASRIPFRQERMAHASEIYSEIRKLGLRYREVPVTIRYSKETLRKGQKGWNAVNIVKDLIFG